MKRNHLTLGLLFLLAFALVSCRASASEPTVPPSTIEEPRAEPAAAWSLSEGRWETYTTDDGLPSNRIRALAVDADGHLWVGTDRAGGRFDGTTWESVIAYPVAVWDIAFDGKGRAWFADGRMVEAYDRGTLTTYSNHEGLASINTKAILIDSQGRIWVGAVTGEGDASMLGGGGINLFEGGQWRHIDTADLFSPTVLDLAEDASGNIWAVGGGGLARFDGTTWQSMRLPGQPVGQVIICVVVDPSGRLWFGAWQSGVWIWDGEAWSQYTPADGLAGDTVWAIAFDGAGRAWLGTGGGLSVFDGETWTTYTVEDGLVNNDVRALAIVEDGIWIGTWNGLSHLVFDSSS